MPIAIGIIGGAALALAQSAITRALAARVVKGGRGLRLGIAFKLPLSLLVLAALGLYSAEALAFAAGGYTAVSMCIAIYTFKRRGE